MIEKTMLIALLLASAIGTVWIYWGVPRRVVANWAMDLGVGYAAIEVLLWILLEWLFETPPTVRIVGGVALGAGIALGGVTSRVLYSFNRPARRDEA